MKDLRYEKSSYGRAHPSIVLDHGSFGIVYSAKYRGLDVAVKEPQNPYAFQRDQSMTKAFYREASNMYKLFHPNVVGFVGAVPTDDGFPCYLLVMEKLVATLDVHLKSLAVEGAGRKHDLLLGLAKGLAFLHSMSIVHRDIKPKNIMVDSCGTPKFIDFGLSKEKSETHPSQASTALAGTTAWMSPEKRKGEASTYASDVFSFGLVMVYILTEQQPAESQIERCRNIKRKHGGYAGSIWALRCTLEDPKERPASSTLAVGLSESKSSVDAAGAQSLVRRCILFE